MKKITSNGRIAGIASCVPKFRYKNINYPYQSKDKVKKFIDLTGIKERRIVNDSKICASDLAYKATKKILFDLNWKNKDIEFLIFITQTPDYLTPASSIILQDRLNLNKNLFALDINLGCSGFPYGISTAFSLIDNMHFKKGILIIGDVSSRLCNIKDSSWLLFGDGCSAIAFERQQKKQINYFDYLSDGSGFKDIIVPTHSLSGRNKISTKDFYELKVNDNIKNNLNMSLNGPNIFSFATSVMPDRIKFFLKYSKINKKKIKYCLLHQANSLINQTIKDKLLLKNTLYPGSLELFGNTSSSSIPISIVNEFGGKKISGIALLSGFGVGLSASSLLYKFKNCKISKFIFY